MNLARMSDPNPSRLSSLSPGAGVVAGDSYLEQNPAVAGLACTVFPMYPGERTVSHAEEGLQRLPTCLSNGPTSCRLRLRRAPALGLL